MSNVRKIADVLENSIEYISINTDKNLVDVFIKQLSAYEDQVRKEIFNDKNGGAK